MINHAMLATSAALLLAAAGCVPAARTAAGGEPGLDADSRRALAESVSAGWAETPRLAARLMILRYGAPDFVASSRLTWHGNGPWKRTVVRDLTRLYAGAAAEDLGVLEQTAAYNLTPAQGASLAAFSGRLSFDPARMEITSRADREEVNFLRLNLANDIMLGAVSVPEAKAAYDRILEFEAAGKTTPYLLGLRFAPRSSTTP